MKCVTRGGHGAHCCIARAFCRTALATGPAILAPVASLEQKCPGGVGTIAATATVGTWPVPAGPVAISQL